MEELREKLRYKILGSLFAVLFLFVLLAWFTLRYIEQPSFVRVEQINTADQLKRARNIIESERQNLEAWVTDWAYWDDTWEFVSGEYPSFYEDNLSEDYLGTIGLNFAVFLDQDLNPVWAEAYDSENGEAMPIGNILQDDFQNRLSGFLPESREDVVSGFIETNSGTAIMALHTILKSSGYGSSRGFLIFGKMLDAANLSKIDRQLVTEIDLLPADPTQLEQDHWQAFNELADLRKPHAIVTRDERIFALGMLRDPSGRPIGILRVAMQRDISLLGKSTMQKSISLLVVAALAVMICLWIMLKKMIITPTERLTRIVEIMRKEMLTEGSRPDLKGTTEALKLWRDGMNPSARRDEFGKLVYAFELFSESLHKSDAEAEPDDDHDGENGIAGRRLFFERLAIQISIARATGARLAVLFLNLEGNNTRHSNGDRDTIDATLAEILDWSRSELEKNPPAESEYHPGQGDFVAQLGCDKMVIVITGDSLEDRAGALERNLAGKLAEFNSAGKEQTGAAASFSLTYFPEDGDSPESMMEHARTSLRAADSSDTSQPRV